MKPKTKKKRHHEPDSSSDSDTPLLELRNNSSKDDLFKYSVEKCEFCDKVFNNKYNMLVHNAKHIIIPLLNQKLHKCSQCQRHFNSVETLEWHAMKSHAYISDNKDYLPKILQSFVQRQPVTVLTKEPFFSKLSNTLNGETDAQVTTNGEQDHIPEILQSFVQKEPVTLLTKLEDPVLIKNEKILESFVKEEPITLLKKESFDIENDESDAITIFDSDDDEDTDIPDVDIKSEIEFEHVNVESDSEEKNPKIKDRIKFEDEDEDDEIFDLNDFVNTSTSESLSIPPNRRNNAIIIGNKPNVTECAENIFEMESIHNDELKKPGMFRCKKCSKMFPNRYEAVIHETSHMKLKRRTSFLCTYCDWYVGCSPTVLIRHKKLKHPEKPTHHRKIKLQKCLECGLAYKHYIRHRQNYHCEFKCSYCDELFKTKSERNEHRLVHSRGHEVAQQTVSSGQVMWHIRTVKVCEFCYHWFKERSNLKYQHVKHYFKLGERLPCERCEKLFFELRIVRMRKRKGKRDPLSSFDTTETRKPKKPITNSERLKNVQLRLQKLKRLNKL